MVLGASLLMSEAMFAAPLAVHSPTHAMFNKEHLVKFKLHNASDAPIKVKAGEDEITLSPGQVLPVKVAVGQKVIVEQASAHFAAGSLLAVVGPELSDATLTLN